MALCCWRRLPEKIESHYHNIRSTSWGSTALDGSELGAKTAATFYIKKFNISEDASWQSECGTLITEVMVIKSKHWLWMLVSMKIIMRLFDGDASSPSGCEKKPGAYPCSTCTLWHSLPPARVLSLNMNGIKYILYLVHHWLLSVFMIQRKQTDLYHKWKPVYV